MILDKFVWNIFTPPDQARIVYGKNNESSRPSQRDSFKYYA